MEDHEGFLDDLPENLTDLEEFIRNYGEEVDQGSGFPEKEAGDDSSEGTDEGDLESLEYRELQDLVQEHDIKANQSSEELVEALKAERDRSGEDQTNEKSSPEETESGDAEGPKGPDDGELVTDPERYDEEIFYDFFSEATEHLDAFEDVLLKLEQERDMDALNKGFRGMHSIKGLPDSWISGGLTTSPTPWRTCSGSSGTTDT